MNNIGENIKALRKEKGWTQSQLADQIDVHLTHVNRIETGKYKPSLEDLIKLSSTFEITVDELINGVQHSNPDEETIRNTPLYQKVKMLEKLDEEDRNTVMNVIDSILTKHKFKDFFQENLAG